MRAIKLLFLVLWLAIFFQLLTNASIKEHLFELLKAHPYAAPLLLVVIQAVLASFALPCSPITVLAGLLWGVWVGLAYSLAATLVASMLTFLLGRYAFRRWLLERMQTGWRRQIIAMIDRFGWKASALAHANPVFPGSSLGYAFGASAISPAAFWLGALVGNLPLQVLMVTAGDLTRNIAEGGATTGVLILILLVAISLVFYRIAAPLILGVPEADREPGKTGLEN
jgi:uncharacterized membrane protein YdjX (TVP38/TMEM64 family)